MKRLLFILFTLAINNINSYAQPGGGGGIIIQTLVDKNGQVISSRDNNLVIRKFMLSDDEGLSVTEYFPSQEKSSFPRHAYVSRDGIYIRPYTGFEKETKMPRQLLQFTWQGDTTFVEFRNLQMENAMGISDQLDTLQLMPGSYLFDFSFVYAYRIAKGTEEEQKRFLAVYTLAQRGLTATTLPQLQPLQIAGRMADKKFITIFKNKSNRTATMCLPVKPIYTMSAKSITIRHNSISIPIQAPPMLESDTLLYRLVMNVPYTRFLQDSQQPGTDPYKIIQLFNELPEKKLYINGQPYTGYLKIFTPFYRQLGNYSGVNMHIIYFDKGILIHQREVADIALDESYQPVRPS